jgi:hypothetical protein
MQLERLFCPCCRAGKSAWELHCQGHRCHKKWRRDWDCPPPSLCVATAAFWGLTSVRHGLRNAIKRRNCRDKAREARATKGYKWLACFAAKTLYLPGGLVTDAIDREERDVRLIDQTGQKTGIVLKPAVVANVGRGA